MPRAKESGLASANEASFGVGTFRLLVAIVSSLDAFIDFDAGLAVALESFRTGAFVRAARVAADAVADVALGQTFCAFVDV